MTLFVCRCGHAPYDHLYPPWKSFCIVCDCTLLRLKVERVKKDKRLNHHKLNEITHHQKNRKAL